MKIECLTVFLDGAERFEKGDQRTCDDERGAYFVKNGWAKEMGTTGAQAESAPESVTLEVQNARMGLGDSNG